MNRSFRKSDLWWIFALPLYQLIGTFRHEMSHAVAALLEGARISKFAILPKFYSSDFYWGYVSWIGTTSWFTTAAPYFIDLLTFLVFSFLCLRLKIRHWIWFNLFIVGVISPFINSFYNYARGVSGSYNDVGKLFYEIPTIMVHLYFLSTMILYIFGIVSIFNRHRRDIQC